MGDMVEARAMGQQHIDGRPVPQFDRPDDRGVAVLVLGLRIRAVLERQRKAFGPLQEREEPGFPLLIQLIEVDSRSDHRAQQAFVLLLDHDPDIRVRPGYVPEQQLAVLIRVGAGLEQGRDDFRVRVPVFQGQAHKSHVFPA